MVGRFMETDRAFQKQRHARVARVKSAGSGQGNAP
nr:DUF2274 domain-containing protein [Acetobacter fabarum]